MQSPGSYLGNIWVIWLGIAKIITILRCWYDIGCDSHDCICIAIRCSKHIAHYTVHSESIQTPWLFLNLLGYSLILKWIKNNFFTSSIHNTPIMTKRKQVFRNCCKCIKKQKNIPYLHKDSDPLLWDSKLSSGASCFQWSSLRCFYNLIGVHLW
jgi:hypothetical protein